MCNSDSELTPSASKTARGNALLAQLQAEFAVFRDCKPLAIGIHKQLLERKPDLDKNKVRVALHGHTASTRYLKALTEGAPRLDLDGQPAGEVTKEQQDVAVKTLRDRIKLVKERQKAEAARRKAEEEAAMRQAKLQQLAEKFGKR
jgi:ProP effector